MIAPLAPFNTFVYYIPETSWILFLMRKPILHGSYQSKSIYIFSDISIGKALVFLDLVVKS